MNQANRTIYLAALIKQFRSDPAYLREKYPLSTLAGILLDEILNEIISNNDPLVVETCKILGIKNTYKAINDFIQGSEQNDRMWQAEQASLRG